VPLRAAVKIAIDALWGLVTLAIILGGILGGNLNRDRGGRRRLHLAFL
jgi:TRAP-type C4-dicarboxylate transport system permease large subunit